MQIEQEIISTKQCRVGLDNMLQSVKQLPPSREVSLTVTKVQEAVMWLGMNLKRINEIAPDKCPNPYPNSKNPSNTLIEPTADNLKL